MPTEQDKDYCHGEDTLLIDDKESTNAAENTKKSKNSSKSLAAMIANMNQTMAMMVGNISSIGNALNRMHPDRTSPSNGKGEKKRLLVAMCSVMRPIWG